MARPKSILWVDDEVEGLAPHRRFLEEQGVTVAPAAPGGRLGGGVPGVGGAARLGARVGGWDGVGGGAVARGGPARGLERAGPPGGAPLAAAQPAEGLRGVCRPPVPALARAP